MQVIMLVGQNKFTLYRCTETGLQYKHTAVQMIQAQCMQCTTSVYGQYQVVQNFTVVYKEVQFICTICVQQYSISVHKSIYINYNVRAGVNLLQIAGTSVPEEFLKNGRFWQSFLNTEPFCMQWKHICKGFTQLYFSFFVYSIDEH